MQCLVPISLTVNVDTYVRRNPNPTPQIYAHFQNQLSAIFLNDVIKQIAVLSETHKAFSDLPKIAAPAVGDITFSSDI